MKARTLLIAAMSAALAGCGGGGGEPEPQPTPKRGVTKPPEPKAEPVVAPEAGVKLELAAEGITQPTHVTGLPGDPDTILVAEQSGRVFAVSGGRKRVFLDLRDRVTTEGPEQGLQTLLFSPDRRRLYAYFTDNGDDIRITEHRFSGGRVSPRGRTVIRIEHPTRPGPNTKPSKEDLRVHNGGGMVFGKDGLLYFGTGDAGGQGDPEGRGQDRDLLLAKIVRIDPRPSGGRSYTIPRDNPFVDGGARPEIWAIGARNPFRLAVHPDTGDLIVADAGQNTVEEVSLIPAGEGGANLGWNCWEGRHRHNPRCDVEDHLEPIIERPSSAVAKRCASVIGGHVVRDESLEPLAGRYIYTDFCESRLRSARIEDGKAVDDGEVGITVPYPSSFGEDAAGRVYVTSYFRGEVYRLAPAP